MGNRGQSSCPQFPTMMMGTTEAKQYVAEALQLDPTNEDGAELMKAFNKFDKKLTV